MNRRDFLTLTGSLAGAATLAAGCARVGSAAAPEPARAKDAALESITDNAQAISAEEHQERVARAQRLMIDAGLDALLIEPGASMRYFSGIQWWRSERLTALLIPKAGAIAVVTPNFEEPSVRESMVIGEDVRTWHEHESPYQRLLEVLSDRGLTSGTIGLEASVRYFVAEGLRAQAPAFALTGASSVIRGCRMYKSDAEIELMRTATAVTLRAYAHLHSKLQAGMSSADISALMGESQRALGGASPWNMALIGRASAYPHGSKEQHSLKEGEILLMDCGCSVHGYQSDISRTFVFGEASNKQRKVWEAVRKGQDIAFASARLGAPAGSVDDAVRSYYESLGYGPDYQTPGLSHRTGHGIGMEGHEPVNIVRGETTPLAKGMCFSNEPGIYDFGSFGVRLEDCIYMTAEGPAWFSVPPESLDSPIGALA